MGRKKTIDAFVDYDGMSDKTPFARLSNKQAKESPTFQSLSDFAVRTLMICRLCRQYHFKDCNKIYGQDHYFYFNRAIQRQYGLNDPNKVHRALVELVQKGFLDVIENNANRRKKNIYAFSKGWLLLDNGQQLELSPQAKTYIRGKG